MYHQKIYHTDKPELRILNTWLKNNYATSFFHWINNFPLVCILNSNISYTPVLKRKKKSKSLDYIIAVGTKNELLPSHSDNFEHLKIFFEKQKTWLFGFLSYDLKNEVEDLTSSGFDGIGMPLIHFFVPEHIFIFRGNELTVHTTDADFNLENLIQTQSLGQAKANFEKENAIINTALKLKIKPRISRGKYIKTVNKIKQHIFRGDIFELNYCQEFYAENAIINPPEIYWKLNKISPMPFSCYYKLRDKYLLCSSPERFLKKEGNKIISQPIKGTIRRGKNKKEDILQAKKLFSNKKEQSENVMIVDLVRNDLSHIAKTGTVKVEELFGIYTYKHLHQMISTVSCQLDKKYHFADAIKKTFPMGSMTGAPKVKAMELIEKFEVAKRGLFSGAVGYITPEGDFDFNVVIRSVLYNKKKRYISAMAGSAITAESEPEKEYQECLLKAVPMLKALGVTRPEIIIK